MGIRKGIANGLTTGFVWFVLYGAYALGTLPRCLLPALCILSVEGFWYGAKLIRDNEYDIGTVTIVSEMQTTRDIRFCHWIIDVYA